MKKTDPYAKTIVFCVDQEHAEEMRKAINNRCAESVRENPDYVVRIVSDEGDIGRGYLSRFQELETRVPAVVTTSRLLTTGVDIPTCKNIAIARVVNSMTEFKQIIGRGTRVRDDYGKLWFTILDYTGSATRLFADPEFDGDPIIETVEHIDAEGEHVPSTYEIVQEQPAAVAEEAAAYAVGPGADAAFEERRKYYVDGGTVEIAAHVVYELDANGKKLRVVRYTDYAGDRLRGMFTCAADLRSKWSRAEERAQILQSLEDHGITFEQLAENTGQPDADPFDLLCHVAFNSPLRTRRERAERLRKGKLDFWDYFRPEAREILDEILEKYVEHGTAQFKVPDILKVPPISEHGNVMEIAQTFGGPEQLRTSLARMQTLLYED